MAKEQEESARVAFGTAAAGYDEEIYDGAPPGAYNNSIDPRAGSDGDDAALEAAVMASKRRGPDAITAPKALLAEADAAAARAAGPDADPFRKHRPKTIADRENSYMARRRNRVLSPQMGENGDARAATAKRDENVGKGNGVPPPVSEGDPPSERSDAPRVKKRRRWDVEAPPPPPSMGLATSAVTINEAPPPKPSKWDTPLVASGQAQVQARPRRRWDATPDMIAGAAAATPSMTGSGAKRSRWDETPVLNAGRVGMLSGTPMIPGGIKTPRLTPGGMVTPEVMHASRWQADLLVRNQPMTDAELDDILPSEGYVILSAPDSYVPIQTPSRRLMATPAPSGTPLYVLPADGGISRESLGIPVQMPEGLQGLDMKPEDYTNFANILGKGPEDNEVSAEEQRERRIMRLLLKIKNGSPAVRKVAMRQITDKAREFGADALFSRILPLLMLPTLEDQERHLYAKVIDRILFKLDDLVRPHVHKVLVVIEPLLIDEDYYARVEGREIISNLAKAAGLPTMIATMRPDIDHQDEFVRNTTARAFAVVASALGIPSMLMFLKAVCRSKKSWEARHTGTKIVQQIAILMGVAVLPHLRSLVEIVESGLVDEQGKVRLITALALAALAEASAPYGIESFDSVLQPLWRGIRFHRGKTLAAFLKAIGYIIPLMDAEYANYYAREVNVILIREFKSPDEEMKTIVLKVVKQCISCEGVEPDYVRDEVVPEYFRCFWVRRMALDRRNFKAVVETTLEIAIKIGGADVISRITEDLKDESEPYRRMVIETIEKITEELGLSDIDKKLEARLIDGLLFAFQEQGAGNESQGALRALSIVIEKLGLRAKPYLEQIVGIVKWRLNNKSARVREHAADLISKMAPVMKVCDEEALMAHMGQILFEYLGEEFPDVLGSILRALKAIVEVIGIKQMQPPIGELLPRLTPILKNRHEKVQENCILLVGRVADRGAEFVSAKEWMRICFELLELLKAPRKAIRKSAVSTFGYIAKAIGPNDVLGTLLNNLKVQERTQRVCTTVAIAIVAETCQPFTVLPSLMNEYRIPELNVQTGVLKSLSFLFEYIGDTSGDYIYALTPVLEDALVDRDLVHRQTACSAVGHLALGVRGLGLEDALTHLLNHVWPNIFETSPHVINAVMSAVQGCMVSLGPGPILLYVLQGLFHPARKVREVYWKVYNSLYVYAQDGLVPSYPNMCTDDLELEEEDPLGEDRYVRHELFLSV